MVVIRLLQGDGSPGVTTVMLSDIQLWIFDLQSFQASHVFCEGNIMTNFVANEVASRVVAG